MKITPREILPLPSVLVDWPTNRPLDPHLVTAALWHGEGNFAKAAGILKCKTARLAAFVSRMPELQEVRARAAELLLDKAELALHEALDSGDPVRQDSASRFILEKAGRTRGWTKDGTQGLALSFDGAKAGALQVKWQTD